MPDFSNAFARSRANARTKAHPLCDNSAKRVRMYDDLVTHRSSSTVLTNSDNPPPLLQKKIEQNHSCSPSDAAMITPRTFPFSDSKKMFAFPQPRTNVFDFCSLETSARADRLTPWNRQPFPRKTNLAAAASERYLNQIAEIDSRPGEGWGAKKTGFG
jgi:hypothetical protein